MRTPKTKWLQPIFDIIPR